VVFLFIAAVISKSSIHIKSHDNQKFHWFYSSEASTKPIGFSVKSKAFS